MNASDLYPMSLTIGPPLPAFLNVCWPWYKAPVPKYAIAAILHDSTNPLDYFTVIGIQKINGAQYYNLKLNGSEISINELVATIDGSTQWVKI